MKPNSKRDKIIHLTVKQDYKSLLTESIVTLSDTEIKLKECALNLLSKSEYSQWSKQVQIGYIENINDDVFFNSDDTNVKNLYKMSIKINELINKVTEDNKL